MTLSNKKIVLCCLFCTALGIKLIYFFQTLSIIQSLEPGSRLLGSDNLLYIKIAENIVSGDWVGGSESIYTSSTPLYAYFLALCFKLAGKTLWLPKLIQLIFGATVPIFVYLITEKIYCKKSALYSSILSMFFLPFTYYEGLICKFSFVPFLSVIFLYISLQSWRHRTFKWWTLFGGICSLFYFFRPNIIILLSLFVPFVFLYPKASSTKCALGLILGIIITTSPILYRTYIAHQRNLTTYLGGIHFYLGNNPKANGTFNRFDDFTPGFKQNVNQAKKLAEKISGKELSAKEVSFFWYKKGLEWILGNPIDFVCLFGKKLFMCLNGSEIGEPINKIFNKNSLLNYFIPTIFIIILGLTGFLFSISTNSRSYILVYFLIGYIFSLCIFLVTGRYRLPIFAALLPPAGHILSIISSNISEQVKHAFKHPIISAALTIMIFFILGNASQAINKYYYNSDYYYNYYRYTYYDYYYNLQDNGSTNGYEAELKEDLTLIVPKIKFKQTFLWAEFKFKGIDPDNNDILFKVTGYGFYQ